jgi:hypothetical protein
MATNKRRRPTLTANGEPVLEQPRPKRRPPPMTQARLESRVAALEKEVHRLKAEREEAQSTEQPWWEKISGTFADDPAHDEAMRLGREWRKSFRPKKGSPRRKKSTDGRS